MDGNTCAQKEFGKYAEQPLLEINNKKTLAELMAESTEIKQELSLEDYYFENDSQWDTQIDSDDNDFKQSKKVKLFVKEGLMDSDENETTFNKRQEDENLDQKLISNKIMSDNQKSNPRTKLRESDVSHESLRSSSNSTGSFDSKGIKDTYHERKLTERGQIIEMKKSGKSISEISRELGLSRQTVYRWVNRWMSEESLKDHKKSGPKRKTEVLTDEAIVNQARNNPFTNSVAIKNYLGLHVAAKTIRNRLHEAGLQHRSAVCKVELSEHHKLDRLLFAEIYANEDMDFWNRVIFTGEKTFNASERVKINCWRLNNSRFEGEKSGNVCANIWGWMCGYGVGETTKIEGRFNTDAYIEILEEVMLPTVRAMTFPYPERIIFMHENSLIHARTRVTKFLLEQPLVDVLSWPSRSCDLNPLENLWGLMVNEWEMRKEKTSEELYQHIVEVWEGVRNRPAILENLVHSMPKRMQCVIENEGGWI